MASSNRHWPSMFKSKPCSSHSSHSSQWQHDINPSLMSSSCQPANRPSFNTSSSAGEETRSPEPKPRWNPKPEQIRILEAIFNSGMVNPPRDEIRRIRIQLQEYGQVGDANVFYWFQNRKSRSKHKQRHLQNTTKHSSSSSNIVQNQAQLPAAATVAIKAPSSSSSSSSEKSSPRQTDKLFSIGLPNGINVIDVSNSPTASVNQTYFHQSTTNTNSTSNAATTTTAATTHPGGGELISTHDPYFFPVQHPGAADPVYATTTQGLMCFSELSNVVQFPEQHIGSCSSVLLGELLNQGVLRKEEDERLRLQQLNYTTTNSATTTIPTSTTPVAASTPVMTQIQEVSESEAMAPAAAARSTVFINREAFEVSVGPINVRQAFGDDALLVYYPSGQPVPTNEWGVTLNSLTPGASYYVVYY